MSPARRAAHAILVRLAAERAPLDLSEQASPELAALDRRDAALAYELVTTTVKRRLALDSLLVGFSMHPLERVDSAALAALRLGAAQLLFLDRVPAHAAVDESVQLVAPLGRRTQAFVNAVLRSVARDGAQRLAELPAGDDVAALALRLSYPEWIVAAVCDELGRRLGLSLLEAGDRPPERCVRVSTPLVSVETAAARLAEDGFTSTAVEALPEALLVDGPALERSGAFREGLVTPQSRGSQLAGAVAAASAGPGVAVADLCAAPGLKTAQLAAAARAGSVLAVEKDAGRADALRATLARLHLPAVQVEVGDALELDPGYNGRFDVVLVDAPCSGLGTLASRADLRWRRRPADVGRLAELQVALLRRAVALLRPGGCLVYSVCTVTRAETSAVVDDLLLGGGLTLDNLGRDYPRVAHPKNGACLLTLPPRDGSSGFFIARLRKDETVGAGAGLGSPAEKESAAAGRRPAAAAHEGSRHA